MLELRDISMEFRSGYINRTTVTVLKDVSLEVRPGHVFGLIGNSGSGKTTLARIAVHTIDPTSGNVILDGEDITGYRFSQMRRLRSHLQLIFQHPETAMNPEMRLGDSLEEALIKSGVPRGALGDRKAEICAEMGISENLLSRYPTQVSGGEIQRIALARVLSFEPEYLFLDEPTSMLDGSVQASILNILKKYHSSNRIGLVFITHDLDLVRDFCTEVAVLDKGRLLANGPTGSVLADREVDYIRDYVDTWDTLKKERYWLDTDHAAGRGVTDDEGRA